MKTAIGRLAPDQLMRWRLIVVKDDIWDKNPAAFSREEATEHLSAKYQFEAEMIAHFEIDDTRKWLLSQRTGDLWYEEE